VVTLRRFSPASTEVTPVSQSSDLAAGARRVVPALSAPNVNGEGTADTSFVQSERDGGDCCTSTDTEKAAAETGLAAFEPAAEPTPAPLATAAEPTPAVTPDGDDSGDGSAAQSSSTSTNGDGTAEAAASGGAATKAVQAGRKERGGGERGTGGTGPAPLPPFMPADATEFADGGARERSGTDEEDESTWL
jgi:hypothetical protein